MRGACGCGRPPPRGPWLSCSWPPPLRLRYDSDRFADVYPDEGGVAWSGGSLLVKSLVGAALASGVLTAAVAFQTVSLWRRPRASIPQRLHHMVVASGLLAGAWAILDLTGRLS